MTTVITAILGILVLGALARGVITLLWAKSNEGMIWSRCRSLGW